ncbi:MAG: xanthine dehydrogenase family protein molybdopterin-binding subunit [Phycisphaeraceae bacterium]|nr:xanthine dehydrogenase family protein molybdopterin-binding subunit [Phycisphaeraceae bacterium]
MSTLNDPRYVAMPTANRPINNGSSMHDDACRMDGELKVTGKAKYGKDIYPANGLFVAFVRCPFGSAQLVSSDADAARSVAGVVEVEVSRREGNYHGATVGHVVAESPAALRRGLAALNCRWRRRADIVTAIEQKIDEEPQTTPDTSALLKEDGVLVLRAVYTTQVQTHSSLETHGVSIDHKGDSATVYASTQGTFSVRDGLDEAIALPRSKYKVVCEFVGGGFGSKLGGAGKEGNTAARIAAKYKRPTYLFVNRAEEHLDTGNRPSSRTHVTMAYRKDGTLLGGDIFTWGGVGPNRGGGGVTIPSGRYNLGAVKKTHEDVSLNAGMPRAFRAPGHPQGAFAEELMLDEIAHACGIDPLELRLKAIREDATRSMASLGARLIGWEQRPKTGAQTSIVRRGMGMGIASWGRFPAQVLAEVVINKDGSVVARTGTQDIGTGQRTMVGIVTADGLGVPLAAVSVEIGRSSLPIGPGSGGSVTTVNSAPAFAQAAADAKGQLLGLLARRAGVSEQEISIIAGDIMHGEKKLATWKDACNLLADSITGKGENNQRTVQADKTTGTSSGAQFVDLSVDTETGVVIIHRVVAVQACGRVVSRKLSESQIIGGVIQGISYALHEDRILDRQTGAMVNPNFEWYKIAGPRDMPLIEPVLWTEGGTGPRSLGEPPTVPTAGAIACAIFNAIGTPVRGLPLTPDRVLAALEASANGGRG